MLNWLEKKLGRFAVPNVTIGLVLGQILAFLVIVADPNLAERFMLRAGAVADGEVWRLVTFLFFPPQISPGGLSVLFLFFALYIFYLMGTALENHWGTFRYNVYLLVAWAGTVAASALNPAEPVTNVFIATSVFFAFAYLYPDFQLMLFLIVPVKVKWLAVFTAVMLLMGFLTSDWLTRATIGASVFNFLLFFGPDIFRRLVQGQRRMHRRAEAIAEAEEPFHRCTICGATEKSHPELEFRYCPECEGAPCYCEEHIHDHEHIGERAERLEARG
ncbi:MAG: rhomboid family intramembrane serine protease [Phycisphaeraceae bacterium]